MISIESLLKNLKWQVFKGLYPTKERFHRCIILNKVLENNEEILYFYMTSKIEKTEIIMKYDKKALVILEKEEWSIGINRKTAVQCDYAHLYKIPVNEFLNKLENKNIEIIGKLPDNIIKKIKKAIVCGKTFSPEERTLLTKD